MEVAGKVESGILNRGKVAYNVCYPCDKDGQEFPPFAFCQECHHHLCHRCYCGHKITLLTRRHSLRVIASTTASYFCDYKLESSDETAPFIRSVSATDSRNHSSDDFGLKGTSSPTQTTFSTRLSTSKTTRVKDIHIKAEEDQNMICNITGIVVLSPGKLLIVDNYNKSVKCLYTSTNTITSYLKLHSYPWSVAILPGEQVAVTLPEAQQIQVLSTAGPLSLVRTIKTNGKCRGIASTQDKLIVSYESRDRQIDVLDMMGKVMNTPQPDYYDSGFSMFTKPWHLAVTNEGGKDVIFVSDESSSILTKLSMSGEVLYTITQKDLVRPCGFIVTDEGYLLVCNSWELKVELVSPQGKTKSLIVARDGLSNPYTVSVCPVENKVYVCNWMQDMLKVYKIG